MLHGGGGGTMFETPHFWPHMNYVDPAKAGLCTERKRSLLTRELRTRGNMEIDVREHCLPIRKRLK